MALAKVRIKHVGGSEREVDLLEVKPGSRDNASPASAMIWWPTAGLYVLSLETGTMHGKGCASWLLTEQELERLRALLRAQRPKKLVMQTTKDWYRASGDVLCKDCCEPYSAHPVAATEEWLHVLCDGSRVKL
jgi:hypothetical protein